MNGTRADAKTQRAEIKREPGDLRNRLEKIHDNIARLLADHEHRVSTFEDKK